MIKMWWIKLTRASWNTYKGKITGLRSGNRGRDAKTMSGLLDNPKSILKDAMGEFEAESAERSH